MAEDISNGSLYWEARVTTSKLADDMQNVKIVLSKGLSIDVDTKALDDLLPKTSDIIRNVKQVASNAQQTISNGSISIINPLDKEQSKIDAITDKAKSGADAIADYVKQQQDEVKSIAEASAYYGVKPGMNNNPTSNVQYKNGVPLSPSSPNSPDNETFQLAKIAYSQLDEVTKNYVDTLTGLEMQLAQVKQEQSAVNAELKSGDLSEEAAANKLSALNASQNELSESIKQTIAAQKEYAEVNNAAAGSMNQQKAQLDQLQQKYAALSETERESAQGQALKQQINDLSASIKTLDPSKVTLAYTELRKLKQEIASGVYTGEDLAKVETRAAELERQITKTNNALKITGSPNPGLAALTEGVRGLAGAYMVASGAITAFTGDNEAATKAMQGMFSAMSMIQGLQEMMHAINSNSGLNSFLQSKLGSAGKAVNGAADTASSAADTAATSANTAAVTANATAKQAQAAAQVKGTVAQEVGTGASIADTAAKETQTAATVETTVATEGLTTALLANPAAAILIAVGALTVGIIAFCNANAKARELQDELNKSMEAAAKSADEQKMKVLELVVTASDLNASMRDRQKAISELNRIEPEHLGNLTAENIGYKASKDAVEDYIQSLYHAAEIKGKFDQVVANMAKSRQDKDDIENAGWWSKMTHARYDDYNTGDAVKSLFTLGLSNFGKSTHDSREDDIKARTEQSKKLTEELTEDTKKQNEERKKAQEGQKQNLAYYQQQQTLLKSQLDGMTQEQLKSAEGLALKKQLLETDKQIKAYDVNTKSLAPADPNKQLEGYQAMLQKIQQLKTSFADVGADKSQSLVDKIKNQFAQISLEIQKFNSNPKNKMKILPQQQADLKNAEEEALKAAEFQKETDAQKEVLKDRQQQYQNYLQWKEKYGEQSANKEFGTDAANFENYLRQQMSSLTEQQSKLDRVKETAMYNEYANRIKIYADYLKKEQQLQEEQARKNLETALSQAQTQQDKLLTLKKQYDTGKQALIDNGATPQELEQYAKSYDSQIDSINKSFDKIKVAQVLSSTTAVTKQQLEVQIHYLENYVATAKNLTKQQAEDLNDTITQLREKALTATNDKSGIDMLLGDNALSNTYTAKLNQIINANKVAVAQIRAAETQLLKDIQANGGMATDQQNNQLAELNAKLAASVEYGKQLEEMQPFAGWLDTLGPISALLGNLASEFKDIDAGLSGTFETMKTLVDAGDNLYKSFLKAKEAIKAIKDMQASGDSKGGILGTISSLGSVIPVIGSVVSGVVGAVSGVINAFKAAKQSAEQAAAELKRYQAQLNLGAIQYNAYLAQQLKLQGGIVQGKLDELRAQEQLNQKQLDSYNNALAATKQWLLANGQYVAGEHTEKSGGFLGIGRKTNVVQDMLSLSGAAQQYSGFIGSILNKAGLNKEQTAMITSDMSNDDIANLLKMLELEGKLTGQTKDFADEFIQLNNDINQATAQAAQLKEQITEAFAGTTADDIAQTILNGLQQGRTSAEQFGDDFNKIISNALLSSIKNTLLSGTVQKIWDTLQSNINADGSITPLTPAEIAVLKKQYADAVNQGNALMQQASDIFPDLAETLNSADGLRQGIQGITEDTANALEGLFRNQLDQVKNINANLMLMMIPLNSIDKNTANTVDRLDKALVKLDALVTNTTSIDIDITPRDTGIKI